MGPTTGLIIGVQGGDRRSPWKQDNLPARISESRVRTPQSARTGAALCDLLRKRLRRLAVPQNVSRTSALRNPSIEKLHERELNFRLY